MLVSEPLADQVTNRNGGLWGPISQISCEHVLWVSCGHFAIGVYR